MSKSEVLITILSLSAFFLLISKVSSRIHGEGLPLTGAVRLDAAPMFPEDDCALNVCVTLTGSTGVGNNFADSPSGASPAKEKLYFFRKVTDFLSRSKTVITGLETPIISAPDAPADRSNLARFWSDRWDMPRALNASGITAVSLANGHIQEFGEPGLSATIAALAEVGIERFGISRDEIAPYTPLRKTFTVGNKTFALAVFAASVSDRNRAVPPGSHQVDPLNPAVLANAVTVYKKEFPGTFAVAYLYMGTPYGRASIAQQKQARALVDAGVDLVVGYGARALQEIELYKNKWILYNLGNFVFTDRGQFQNRPNTPPFGGALRIVLTEQGAAVVPTLKLYPLHANNLATDYQPRFLNKKEFGAAYWCFLRKSAIEYNWWLKRNMVPEKDVNGPFIRLTGAR